MRTMQVVELGAPLALREAPRPAPGPGELLLRVHYSSLNY